MSWIFALSLISSLPPFTDWVRSWGEDESPVITYRRFDLAGPTLVADKEAIFIATPDGNLERIHLKTGESDWRVRLEGVSQAKWTYFDGALFGGDTKGFIYSIDAETGETLWKNRVKGIFFAAPLVTSDFAYFKNAQGILYTYSRSGGAWIWQYQDEYRGATSMWTYQGPVLFNDRIIAGFGSGNLMAFQPDSGNRVWTEPFGTPLTTDGELNDVKALATSENYLAASSFSGNVKVWKKEGASKRLVFEKRHSLIAPPLIREEDNLILLPVSDSTLKAVNLETGFVEWNFALHDGGLAATPAQTDTAIWVASSQGHIYVLDSKGELRTETPSIQTSIWNPPVVDKQGQAYVLSSKALLRKFRLAFEETTSN